MRPSTAQLDLNIPQAQSRTRWAWLISLLLLLIIALPLLAGLENTLNTALSAEGDFSLQHFRDFLTQPGLYKAWLLSLWSGLASTALALLISSYITQCWLKKQLSEKQTNSYHWKRFAQVLLAFPHVAFAIAFTLLLAPSGSLLRWLSPWATGFSRPPTWTTIHDGYGLTLIMGLALKEAAFFTLTLMAIAQQAQLAPQWRAAQSLGYTHHAFWWKFAMPQLYRQLRLPIWIVLSFSITVVEISLLLAPTTPPPMSVLIWQQFLDADASQQPIATAGALLLTATALASFGVWHLGERCFIRLHQRWQQNGKRRLSFGFSDIFALIISSSIAIIVSLSLLSLLLFGLSWRWTFPQALPEQWQISLISKAFHQLNTPLINTLLLALLSASLTLILVLGLLSALQSARNIWLEKLCSGLMLLPLLLPPLMFLIGIQRGLIRWGLEGSLWAVLLGHMLYLLPYAYLVLRDPWREFDPMIALQARLLLGSAWCAFWRIKVPLLMPSITYAAALCIAVSVAQYLTTLLLGAGYYPTITTEAIVLSSGGDRRLIAIYAMAQCLLPLLGFFLANSIAQYARRRMILS